MESVQGMLRELAGRSLTGPEMESKRKVAEMATELQKFVDEVNHTLKSDNLYLSSVMPQKSRSKQPNDLEEPLLDQMQDSVEVKDVLNQYDKVEQRHEDIVAVESRSKRVNEVSRNILNVTLEQDLKLGGIVKHQLDHEKKVTEEINPEFVRTKEIQAKMLKKVCCLGTVAVVLALLLVLMVLYVLKKDN
jgi:hypothetical protein